MTAPAASRLQLPPSGAELENRIDEASQAVARRLPEIPRVAIVLGSGLGDAVELLDGHGQAAADRGAADGVARLPYAEIPHVPDVSVAGHAGEIVSGRVGALPVAILSGRAHPYEGYSHQEVTILVRALFVLGLETLVVTNAAGALDPLYEPGDLMLIADMINLSGDNPLRGPNIERFGTRFPAMANAFDPALRAAARRGADRVGVHLREGVYVMLAGPNYETRAEMRMLRLLGADAVGMSTVPEVLVARHAGVRVLGFSLITNKEPADDEPATSHQDVIEMGRRGARRLAAVLRELLPELG